MVVRDGPWDWASGPFGCAQPSHSILGVAPCPTNQNPRHPATTWTEWASLRSGQIRVSRAMIGLLVARLGFRPEPGTPPWGGPGPWLIGRAESVPWVVADADPSRLEYGYAP
jgi:hypothetical protein